MANQAPHPPSGPIAQPAEKVFVQRSSPPSSPTVPTCKVTASPLPHRGGARIQVALPYSPVHLRQLRSIEGARWGQTRQCWHLPKTKEAWAALNALFDVTVVVPGQAGEIRETGQTEKPASQESTKLTVQAHPARQDIIGLRLPKERKEQHLGHESSKTTEIYTHITSKGIHKIKSPLDDLDL